jgi:uncharacterized protein (DUF362 family)
MPMYCSRRKLLQAAGAGLLLQSPFFRAVPAAGKELPAPVSPSSSRSRVSLIQGENRRQNVYDALVAIDDQIRPRLQRKKYVVIKPNNVSTSKPLASTHAEAMRGILDYLAPRFKGPVVIAESSAENTLEGFEAFQYPRLIAEYRAQKLRLIDLNQEARAEIISLIDFDLHVAPVRLAARLFDPEAFVISSAILKTHDTVVATMAVKNMVLGAPLHNAPKETPTWSDKEKFHVGIRQMQYNMFLTAQKMQPNWGVALIDGFEGMEGMGPTEGTPVASRIAIASTDFIAADRIALETMGINSEWLGYLKYCGQAGIGQYDLSKIDVQGAAIAAVRKPYRLAPDVDRQLQWMGPMKELPPKMG